MRAATLVLDVVVKRIQVGRGDGGSRSGVHQTEPRHFLSYVTIRKPTGRCNTVVVGVVVVVHRYGTTGPSGNRTRWNHSPECFHAVFRWCEVGRSSVDEDDTTSYMYDRCGCPYSPLSSTSTTTTTPSRGRYSNSVSSWIFGQLSILCTVGTTFSTTGFGTLLLP
jgi:hypothetical protein